MIRSPLELIFVDNPFLHYWPCHRLPARSFRIDGRQFHICARCTGVISGVLVAPVMLPFAMLLGMLAAPSIVLLVLDGLTQLLSLRTSSNPIRFATGTLASVCAVAWIFNHLPRI
ncbi:DUF2085 domain-containing protein [bacterium]|nr:MAG: DUF2085 domain-containing protein [bacterium]